jgi:hypothetical protein
MKAKKVLICLLGIVFLQFSCSNLYVNKDDTKATTIIGEWEISSIDQINDPYLIVPSDSMDLIKLFGVQTWVNAKGKHFIFNDGGELKTDILTGEMADLVDLSYKYDSVLVIISKFKNQKLHYDTRVNLKSLKKKQMIWDLGELLRITLNKIEN